ncbi:hypothetical protein GCM10027404_26080 [Arthrobacter tumbae]|uniref:hypothetical protein n=1 Tax=Arthrobacter tumbae TaxID=163874 RepID=UPI001956C3A1|nr:hypothetical protein [Arthrobacter tumbae]MBM7781631.1 hypothetical protein [Arthrobacter tumbae]
MSESTSDEPQEINEDLPGAPPVDPDVQSDPAADASNQGDWTGEGGATPSGAATEAADDDRPANEEDGQGGES